MFISQPVLVKFCKMWFLFKYIESSFTDKSSQIQPQSAGLRIFHSRRRHPNRSP